jgi:cob(I)alamin adenosyltransferase
MAQSSVIVFTGDGKGKTEAALGLTLRALGADFKVAFVQFAKAWEVSEDKALAKLSKVYGKNLAVKKGGKGFYDAGKLSAKNVDKSEHKAAAEATYGFILTCAQSGKYDLVIADEINNVVHDGLLSKTQLRNFIKTRHKNTHLCLTGRNFPPSLLSLVNYATSMEKQKHPYDDGRLAILGIDY